MRFAGALGTFIVRAGDAVAGKTGLSEREALSEGLDFFVSLTHSPDHATYFPGGTMMAVKLVVERGSGRLLGAQVAGGAGVDKRLDVFATAIAAKMTVDQLGELDLAYAPPFSSARDPAQMAGMVAANLNAGAVEAITPAELRELQAAGDRQLRIIDVRTPEEHARGSIPGAVLMPLDQLRGRLQELEGFDPNGLTVMHCRSGQRSYVAARLLEQRGFRNVRNLAGGYLSYLADLDARNIAGDAR